MFLLINKPPGPTSHDIIDQLRKITGIRKIGHAGTLDPFASGLLIIGIGRESTKRLGEFLKLDKTYLATLKLESISDTYDKTGNITQITKNTQITKSQIEPTIQQFIGPQLQTPPMYSARKIQGKKLYQLARQGLEIKRKPVKINIYDIQLINFLITNHQLLTTVHCSSGSYIRSLAHDIGQALGCGAYLEELQRTRIGEYKLEDAVDIDQLNKDNWQKYISDLEI